MSKTRWSALKAGIELNVSHMKIRNMVERGELMADSVNPLVINKSSIMMCKARNRRFDSIDGKLEIVYTHLGQIRKIVPFNAFVVKDIALAIGNSSTFNITERVDEKQITLLRLESCKEFGMQALAKGHSLITLEGISEYLKSSVTQVDKGRFIQELRVSKIVEEVQKGVAKKNIILQEPNEQMKIDEAKADIAVLDQRELLGKIFKIYGTMDKPLFLAKDVAEMIDYSKNPDGSYKVSMMLKTIDETEKLLSTVLIAGQNRSVSMLTEDGLYEVLMQSRKPIAKQFKNQVKEILKSIRKTGGYVVPTQEEVFVDNYFGNLPIDTQTIMINALCERNSGIKEIRSQLMEDMKAIDEELKANSDIINKLFKDREK